MLQYRKQVSYDTLPITLYKLFEAKKLAEVYSSVGSWTDMFVLTYDTSSNVVLKSLLMPAGFQFLQMHLTDYGPKELPHDLPFPTNGISFEMPIG
jgi:hypothetical protein